LIESDDLVRDRIRDYSPTHVELAPGLNDGRHWQLSGQAHVFRQFIFDEVMPLITTTYRTEQMNILAGHSQGGLFATDTLLAGGSRFKGYIAASPSFWWDDQMMISKFSEWVQATESSAFYYFSVASGDKPEAQHPINKIHDLLSYQAPNSFNWKFDYFSNETHSSIVLKSYYEGLMHIFRRYPIPESALNGGSESVNKHYKRLSDELGYTMLPSEKRINSLGYKQMWNSNVPAAIEFFLWNVKTYPASANAEDSLAEAYANFGDTEKAITHYQKSLALNPNNKNALNMLKKLALKSEDKERGHPYL